MTPCFRSCLVVLVMAMAAADDYTTVGREGMISVVLANPHLQSAPVDDRAPLVVRIAARESVADGTRYDLRWLGAEPGTYDLSHFLVDVAGQPAPGLAAIPIRVHTILPPGYPGDLSESAPPETPHLGGYKRTMLIIGMVWLAILPLLLWRRQRRRAVVVAALAPSLSTQLREIIARARSADASADQRALLERLLLAHWRERLTLQDMDAPRAIQRLREHPEAGALLRHLDLWLHAPPGRADIDIDALLAPYSDATTP